MIQQFFKNKVFWGIESIPLKRKIYRGKRDKDGSRKNECFYVSEDQKYRIEESVLVKNVNLLLEEVINMKDKYIQGWNNESSEQYFEILNRNALQNVNTESDYKNFICDYLNQQSSQEYENVKLKSNIEKCEFKNIIEKIKKPLPLFLLAFSSIGFSAPVLSITPYNPPIAANTTAYKAKVSIVETGVLNKSYNPIGSVPSVESFPLEYVPTGMIQLNITKIKNDIPITLSKFLFTFLYLPCSL